MIRIPAHVRNLGVCQFPDQFCRTAQDKCVGRKLFPLCYEGAGTYQGTGPYLDPTQHYSAHPDEAIISYDAGVEDCPVANRDVLAYQAGCIGIDMNHRTVLYVCGFANLDRGDIRTDDGGKPDGRVVTCTDSTCDFRVPGYEYAFSQYRDGIADRMDHTPFLIATG